MNNSKSTGYSKIRILYRQTTILKSIIKLTYNQKFNPTNTKKNIRKKLLNTRLKGTNMAITNGNPRKRALITILTSRRSHCASTSR